MIGQKDLEARKIAAKSARHKPQLDSPVDNLKEAMRKSGVERAVILPIDSGLNQEMPLSLREKTDWHANEVREDDSLITFVGLEKGCRGLKLYPPNGFYPDDEKFYDYYKLCVDLNIPIVIHQGFTSRFKHVKYARPVFVDQVAADFPNLRIVLAHVGTPWEQEALMIAAKNPNVSVDVAGWQIFASRVPSKLYRMIAEAKFANVFPNRMMWGSDFPLFEHAMPLKEWVQFFSTLRLPQEIVDLGYEQVTDNEIDAVMWKNAARLFFGE
jgi:predicted TIM-barrel fold metal-dependent hydrolase